MWCLATMPLSPATWRTSRTSGARWLRGTRPRDRSGVEPQAALAMTAFSAPTGVLLQAMKFHVVAALVKTVFSGFRPCDELQRYRTLDFRVLCRRNLEQVICAQIHNHKFVVIDEPAAVRARLEGLPSDFDRHIRDEVSLIFFLDP